MQTLTKFMFTALALVMLAPAIALATSGIATIKHNSTDSTETRTREVMTSQQMFMVKYSPVKGKTIKGKKRFNFHAELREVFMVTYFDKDTTYTVTDWLRSPEKQRPVMGTYKYGTPEYKRLDTLIALSKKNSLDEQKKFARMMAGKRK